MKLDIPKAPTMEQLKQAFKMAYDGFSPESQKLSDDVCKLLQSSPEMLGVIHGFIDKSGEEVTMRMAGATFTGGFITGYLTAFAMMRLEED